MLPKSPKKQQRSERHDGKQSGAWPMGEVLMIDGDPLGPVVCNDRGRLAPHQVDRFFWREEDGWAWLRQVGGYARVQRER